MKIVVPYRYLAAGFVVGLFTLTAGLTPVVADVFTIDTNQSSLTVTGSVQGASFAQQGPGSLTTKYGGTIQAVQTANTIQFTGLSAITAHNSGSWQPLTNGVAGSAPANYGATASLAGGFATALAALRLMLLDVTSPPISVNSGQFDSRDLTFLFPTNATSTLDYKVSGLVNSAGSKPLTGNATNNVASLATLTTVGNQQTLTILVNAKFFFTLVSANDTIVDIAGQIVAHRAAVAPLLIQSITVRTQVVTLQWQSAPGQLYQVQSSTNLATWQTNAVNVTSATTAYSWRGTNTAPMGLFRLAQ